MAGPSDTPLARAKAIALRSLAVRPRTEAWIRTRLAKDALQAEADEVVRWLLHLGYLDDAAFARARARALVGRGGLGPRLAERRLVAAGVDRRRAEEAVAGAVAEAGAATGSAAEAALCRALAERRARGKDLATLDARERARLGRFLLGRGFSGSVVARTLGIFEDG